MAVTGQCGHEVHLVEGTRTLEVSAEVATGEMPEPQPGPASASLWTNGGVA